MKTAVRQLYGGAAMVSADKRLQLKASLQRLGFSGFLDP